MAVHHRKSTKEVETALPQNLVWTTHYVVFIHAENVDHAADEIPEVLLLNQYSGFSLPLLSSHPDYQFADHQPALPPVHSYLQLLDSAFQSHPHYDYHFDPVNELAQVIREGGWNRIDDLPARIQLVARKEGVRFFRHAPGLSRPWLDWSGLMSLPQGAILPRLFEAYRSSYAWDTNPACGKCRWRWVCGGADGWQGEAEPIALPEAFCRSRMHFLESLIGELFA